MPNRGITWPTRDTQARITVWLSQLTSRRYNLAYTPLRETRIKPGYELICWRTQLDGEPRGNPALNLPHSKRSEFADLAFGVTPRVSAQL